MPNLLSVSQSNPVNCSTSWNVVADAQPIRTMSEFPVVENPAKLKVVELKEELEKRGMPTSGLKKDVRCITRTPTCKVVGPVTNPEQLVTRLEEAQGLAQPPVTEEDKSYPEPAPASTKGEDVDHATPGDEVKDAAVPPKEISDSNPPAIPDNVKAQPAPEQVQTEEKEAPITEESKEEVGHVMVEGTSEKTAEIRQLEAEAIKSPEKQILADLQPAALDPEVAAAIAEEEMKDTVPPSPGPVRSLSPLPATGRPATPPMDDDGDVLDLGDGDTEAGGSKKRGREADPAAVAPKRPKRRQFPPLPESLTHLVHPPTTCIYISNLRRPLLLPTLHEFLFPEHDEDAGVKSSSLLPPPKAPFASDSYPNIWLSGVKSHAYAVFDTVDAATETAKRIDGKVFPEETGSELKVNFVDEDEITRLVQREEQAWANGRQKLDLKITSEEADKTYRFDLIAESSTSTASARVIPRGPAAGPSSTMRGGFGMNGRGGGARPPQPFGGRPLTGVNATPAAPGHRGGPPPSRPYSNGNGNRFTSPPRRDQSPPRRAGPGPGLGPRDAPPHFDRDRRDRMGGGGGGGDSYRPGGDDRGFARGGGGAGGDSYRPNDRDGDFRRGGDHDRRTDSRPNLSWREGPRR